MYDEMDAMPVHAPGWNARRPVLKKEEEDFEERKTETCEFKSPDHQKTIRLEIQWGKKKKQWYFISLTTKRTSNGEPNE